MGELGGDHHIAADPLHARNNKINSNVPITDTTMDPRHPNRLEKKKNT